MHFSQEWPTWRQTGTERGKEKIQSHLHCQSQSSTHTGRGVSHKANEMKANSGQGARALGLAATHQMAQPGPVTQEAVREPVQQMSMRPFQQHGSTLTEEHRGDGQARNNLITGDSG